MSVARSTQYATYIYWISQMLVLQYSKVHINVNKQNTDKQYYSTYCSIFHSSDSNMLTRWRGTGISLHLAADCTQYFMYFMCRT